MIVSRALLGALFAALCAPAFAASTDDAAKNDEKQRPPAERSLLPRSMQINGVIGHVELPDGFDVFDPEILARMRARLEAKIKANE